MKKPRVASIQGKYAEVPYGIQNLIFTFFDARDQARAAGVNRKHYKVSGKENRPKYWQPSGNGEIDTAIPPRKNNSNVPLEGHGLHHVTELDLSHLNFYNVEQIIRALYRFRDTLVSLKWFPGKGNNEASVVMTKTILQGVFECPKLEELKLRGFTFIPSAAYLLGDVKNLRALTITQSYLFNNERLFTERNDQLEILECDSLLITENIGNLYNLKSLCINNTFPGIDPISQEGSRRGERAIANLKFLPKKFGSKPLKISFEMPPTLNILLEFLKNIPDSVDCLEFYVAVEDIQNILVRDEDRIVKFQSFSPEEQSEFYKEVTDELRRLKRSDCYFSILDNSHTSPLLDFMQESIEQVQETSSCAFQR